MKPMLEFTRLPPRAEERPKRRRKKKVKSPENPKVRSVPLAGLYNQPSGHEDEVGLESLIRGVKWVSPQFQDDPLPALGRKNGGTTRRKRKPAPDLKGQLFPNEPAEPRRSRRNKKNGPGNEREASNERASVGDRVCARVRPWGSENGGGEPGADMGCARARGWSRVGLTRSQDISLYPSVRVEVSRQSDVLEGEVGMVTGERGGVIGAEDMGEGCMVREEGGVMGEGCMTGEKGGVTRGIIATQGGGVMGKVGGVTGDVGGVMGELCMTGEKGGVTRGVIATQGGGVMGEVGGITGEGDRSVTQVRDRDETRPTIPEDDHEKSMPAKENERLSHKVLDHQRNHGDQSITTNHTTNLPAPDASVARVVDYPAPSCTYAATTCGESSCAYVHHVELQNLSDLLSSMSVEDSHSPPHPPETGNTADKNSHTHLPEAGCHAYPADRMDHTHLPEAASLSHGTDHTHLPETVTTSRALPSNGTDHAHLPEEAHLFRRTSHAHLSDSNPTHLSVFEVNFSNEGLDINHPIDTADTGARTVLAATTARASTVLAASTSHAVDTAGNPTALAATTVHTMEGPAYQPHHSEGYQDELDSDVTDLSLYEVSDVAVSVRGEVCGQSGDVISHVTSSSSGEIFRPPAFSTPFRGNTTCSRSGHTEMAHTPGRRQNASSMSTRMECDFARTDSRMECDFASVDSHTRMESDSRSTCLNGTDARVYSVGGDVSMNSTEDSIWNRIDSRMAMSTPFKEHPVQASAKKSILKKSCCTRHHLDATNPPCLRKTPSKSVTFKLPSATPDDHSSGSVLARETPEHMWRALGSWSMGGGSAHREEVIADSDGARSGPSLTTIGILYTSTAPGAYTSPVGGGGGLLLGPTRLNFDVSTASSTTTTASVHGHLVAVDCFQEAELEAEAEDMSILATETPADLWLSPQINFVNNSLNNCL